MGLRRRSVARAPGSGIDSRERRPLSYGSPRRATYLACDAINLGAIALPAPDLRDELLRTHPGAFAWAVRSCRGDRDEAEEVLQVAYTKVLEGTARFDGRSTFRTWLFGVIRVTAHEQRRMRWLQLARLERWWLGTRRDDDAQDEGSREDDDRIPALKAAMERLSARQSEVLHLVFYQELTIQEAADVLGMPVGTARTHYERGKARLRALLGETGGR